MDTPKTTFKIGLAMAGAVSAGAYTAGVLDFLIEALDAWYDARARGENVPRHDISLDVASGASAGAMCATLLAIALPYRFPHARLNARREPNAEAADNPFYRAWVEDIDIRPMLGTDDLAGGELPSLLNCEVIDKILAQALEYRAVRRERPYVTRPFVARFTVGNLRGVPYDISYRGLRSASDALYAHDDYLGFLVGGADGAVPPSCTSGHQSVTELASAQAPDWGRLGAAAVASGAFPIFLKPRTLSRDGKDYNARSFGNPDAADASQRMVTIPPVWPKDQAPAPYNFVAVDGGIFNNEPLDLAREVLAGDAPDSPADGARASSAVMMIAPFVGRPGDGSEVPLGPPHQLILPMLFSFIAQCRFKPADVALAHDPTVYNRFLIAPVGSNSPTAAPYWIAGGPMQGFFGFLHKEFRKHDYQLGRRNCQRFLQQDFRLPRENPIVAYGYAELLPAQAAAWIDQHGELPIIPLIGDVAKEEPLCEWPAGQFQVAELGDAIGARVEAIFRYYRDSIAADSGKGLTRLITRAYLQIGWWAGRKQVLASLRGSIEAALKAQQL